MKRLPTIVVALMLAASWTARADTPRETAREILERSGVRGGLIVHVGCGDGSLTAALAAGGRYVVQGLEADPAKIERVRARLRSLGQYGAVSVTGWDGRSLPYAGSLVNLVVLSRDAERVSEEELLRVLTPGGVALALRPSSLAPLRKPWPEEIDEWSHYLHDASNNAVAQDTRVGPPGRLKWVCGPLWARSHEFISSIAAMVSAGGRGL